MHFKRKHHTGIVLADIEKKAREHLLFEFIELRIIFHLISLVKCPCEFFLNINDSW